VTLKTSGWQTRIALIVLAAALPAAPGARADVITDSNAKAAEIASKLPATPPAVRAMAFVQVTVFEAVNAITGRYPPLQTKINAAPATSVDAAVAAATRAILSSPLSRRRSTPTIRLR
jgi:hypothetical protein